MHTTVTNFASIFTVNAHVGLTKMNRQFKRCMVYASTNGLCPADHGNGDDCDQNRHYNTQGPNRRTVAVGSLNPNRTDVVQPVCAEYPGFNRRANLACRSQKGRAALPKAVQGTCCRQYEIFNYSRELSDIGSRYSVGIFAPRNRHC